MKLDQIECFLLAAQELSYSAVAEKSYVSRQAVSRAVYELEKDLNVKLFLTDANNHLYLTEAGKKLLPEFEELMAKAEHIRKKADSFSRKRSPVRVAYADTVAPFILQDTVGMLYGLQCREKNLISEIRQLSNVSLSEGNFDDADLVIMIGKNREVKGYYTQVLRTSEAVLSVPFSSPLYSKEVLRTEDLKGLTVIEPLAGCPELEALADRYGFSILPISNFYETSFYCIEKGCCVLDVPYPLEERSFVQKAVEGLRFTWDILLLWKQDSTNPNLSRVRDRIISSVR